MIIGITGMLGSGKSTIARMLAHLTKMRLVNADEITKGFLSDKKVMQRIGLSFPSVIVKGEVDKKSLANIVFKDRIKLAKLERILHPPVIKEITSKSKGGAILDVPLLVEAGLHEMCDVVIVIKCAEAIRVKRLMKKGFSLEEIKSRTRMQIPLTKKIKYADYSIDNSKSMNETKQQIRRIVNKIFQ